MAILETDIKLLKSQVMDDVPEGGGQSTPNPVVDGVSNNMFQDISELDRVYGRVNLRKVFPAVVTPDTEGYFGVHVILAKPPEDPLVSGLLFTTEDAYDERASAKNRIEAYLAMGPLYSPYLFGAHIAGMMSLTLLGQLTTPIPVIGETMVITKYNALNEPIDPYQYVRIDAVSTQILTFTDEQGEFKRLEIVLGITDPLNSDYSGFEAKRQDASLVYTNKGRVHTTVVADAARYYGIVPLALPALTGDFVVKGTTIFQPIVPAAEAETPIIDARMNQRAFASAGGSGGTVTRGLFMNLNPTQNVYLGAGILPNTLLLEADVNLFDRDGFLIDEATDNAVGTVDYGSGILTASTTIYSGSFVTISYTASSEPEVVSQSLGRFVSQEARALTWVTTLDPPPSKGSLSVSYRAQGAWYVLSDKGSGGLRGSDPAFGAGSINFETGTVVVTLGALPDVDSYIIYNYARGATLAINLDPVNLVSEPIAEMTHDFGKPILPGSVTIEWTYSGSTYTATDNGAGAFTGDLIGVVDYGRGLLRFAPAVLPAINTYFDITSTQNVAALSTVTLGTAFDNGSTWRWTVPAGAIPAHSFRGLISVTVPWRSFNGNETDTRTFLVDVVDNGVGDLYTVNPGSPPSTQQFAADATLCGAINYGTGEVFILKDFPMLTYQGTWALKTYSVSSGIGPAPTLEFAGVQARNVTAVPSNASIQIQHANGTSSTPVVVSIPMDKLVVRLDLGAGNTPALNTSFQIGNDRYILLASGLKRNIDPVTGIGVMAGGVVGREIHVNSWPVGQLPNVTYFQGRQQPPIASADTNLLVDAAFFRTAVAPIKSESLNVAGTWADGTTFSVFADADGVIATGGAPPTADGKGTRGIFGIVDYTTGVVQLKFGSRVGENWGLTEPKRIYPFDYIPQAVPEDDGFLSEGVRADTLRYNAAAFTYIPLDSDILGLDPVRLPADGRVPIFRAGSVAVVHHTDETVPATVANSDTIDTGRNRLSRVRVIGADGETILTGYTANLDSGVVTFTDVTGYSQPVRVEHRIEDVALVRDSQINGLLTMTRALTHDYPDGSYVSSALLIGDMRARVSLLFDQTVFTGVWDDVLIGSATLAEYDDINNPIVVTNESAITERWILQFIGSTNFNIIGEHVGQVGTGTTGGGAAPINPATSQPYFTMSEFGFGSGWSAGNIIRMNTVAARQPIWVGRIIRQGPATADDDLFTVLVRGDIDAP